MVDHHSLLGIQVVALVLNVQLMHGSMCQGPSQYEVKPRHWITSGSMWSSNDWPTADDAHINYTCMLKNVRNCIAWKELD